MLKSLIPSKLPLLLTIPMVMVISILVITLTSKKTSLLLSKNVISMVMILSQDVNYSTVWFIGKTSGDLKTVQLTLVWFLVNLLMMPNSVDAQKENLVNKLP